MFDMLRLVSSILLSFHHHMKSTSSSQHAIVVSLLSKGYSVCQIQSKSGIEKSTMERIKKEVDSDKENSKGGHPSKLSHCDKQSIIHQITTGKLDNAIQTIQFINNIFPSPVTPQTVRNALKSNDFHFVIKQKCPLLKKAHREDCLKFSQYHENWTVKEWKMVLWSDKTKINRIGSDGRVYTWKKKGESLSDRTTTPTVKHGGGNNLMVWGCMGWNGVGELTEVQGIMDAKQYCEILEDGLVESFEELEVEEGERIFQQDNDPNTPQNWQQSGLKTTTSMS
jgi:transposase